MYIYIWNSTHGTWVRRQAVPFRDRSVFENRLENRMSDGVFRKKWRLFGSILDKFVVVAPQKCPNLSQSQQLVWRFWGQFSGVIFSKISELQHLVCHFRKSILAHWRHRIESIAAFDVVFWGLNFGVCQSKTASDVEFYVFWGINFEPKTASGVDFWWINFGECQTTPYHL